jgi:Tol biopolymer transport system component
MGARLDVAGRKLLSDPVQLVDEIEVLTTAAQYDVSNDGALIYLPAAAGAAEGRSALTVVRPNGTASKFHDAVRRYSDPRLSPDGKKLALHLIDEQDDIWVLDIGRKAMTRITFDADEDETPAWSPDGQWIAFAGYVRDGSRARGVFRRRADGGGDEELLWKDMNHSHVTDWSPDGKSILIEVADPKQRSDIYVIDIATKTGRPLIATPFSEASARVSPDGKWVAYRSEESGRGEVYVQAYPGLGQKALISVDGGGQPVWSRDGRTIYFRSETDFRSAHVVVSDAAIQASAPTVLMPDRFVQPQAVNHTTYEVFSDGSLLVFAPPEDGVSTQGAVIAVFNWLDEARAKIAGK